MRIMLDRCELATTFSDEQRIDMCNALGEAKIAYRLRRRAYWGASGRRESMSVIYVRRADIDAARAVIERI